MKTKLTLRVMRQRLTKLYSVKLVYSISHKALLELYNLHFKKDYAYNDIDWSR